MVVLNVDVMPHSLDGCCSNLGLRLADMLLAEEELTVQIADIDGIQINLKTNTSCAR